MIADVSIIIVFDVGLHDRTRSEFCMRVTYHLPNTAAVILRFHAPVNMWHIATDSVHDRIRRHTSPPTGTGCDEVKSGHVPQAGE